MKLTLTLALALLVGCAAPPPRSPEYQKCEYEAEKATPDTRNVFADVFRKNELINMCLKTGSYK